MYRVLTESLNKEDKIEEVVQVVHKLQDSGISPQTVLFNTILLGLCRNGKTDYAIDVLADMVSCGCMPDESTYIILKIFEGGKRIAKQVVLKRCTF
jgi:pentatricopeptide repeat protein